MKLSQVGDHLQVHYVKRFPDGAVRSSRDRGDGPVEVTVGTSHPRLPGLKAELVGLKEGNSITVIVPAERAYGVLDPSRIKRVSRDRFGKERELTPGRRVRMQVAPGRMRTVRIVEVRGQIVVVDTNHPRCGQALVLEVEVIAIASPPEIAKVGMDR